MPNSVFVFIAPNSSSSSSSSSSSIGTVTDPLGCVQALLLRLDPLLPFVCPFVPDHCPCSLALSEIKSQPVSPRPYHLSRIFQGAIPFLFSPAFIQATKVRKLKAKLELAYRRSIVFHTEKVGSELSKYIAVKYADSVVISIPTTWIWIKDTRNWSCQNETAVLTSKTPVAFNLRSTPYGLWCTSVISRSRWCF